MQRMKNLYLIALCSVVFYNGFSQTKNFIDQPYLETNAKVDTLVSPDRIYLTILISEKDTKGKISVEELENKMADQLKSIGIDIEKQLKLGDLTSNFKKYFLKQKDVLKSKNFTLQVYDAFTAGKVLLILEKIGISNINIDRTEYSKIEDLRLALKSRAVLKAKRQGEALLHPLNQKLGKAILISDFNTRFYNNLQGRVAGLQVAYNSEDGKNKEPLDIQFEKIKVQCEINVKFIIE